MDYHTFFCGILFLVSMLQGTLSILRANQTLSKLSEDITSSLRRYGPQSIDPRFLESPNLCSSLLDFYLAFRFQQILQPPPPNPKYPTFANFNPDKALIHLQAQLALVYPDPLYHPPTPLDQNILRLLEPQIKLSILPNITELVNPISFLEAPINLVGTKGMGPNNNLFKVEILGAPFLVTVNTGGLIPTVESVDGPRPKTDQKGQGGCCCL